jgi:hypothetical protein
MWSGISAILSNKAIDKIPEPAPASRIFNSFFLGRVKSEAMKRAVVRLVKKLTILLTQGFGHLCNKIIRPFTDPFQYHISGFIYKYR